MLKFISKHFYTMVYIKVCLQCWFYQAAANGIWGHFWDIGSLANF